MQELQELLQTTAAVPAAAVVTTSRGKASTSVFVATAGAYRWPQRLQQPFHSLLDT